MSAASLGAPRSDRSFLRSDLIVCLLGLALLGAWEAARLDLALIRPWGTPTGFPLSENFWARKVLHDGGRNLGWVVFAGVLWGAARGALGLSAARWRAIAVTMLACVLAISALKGRSLTSCPWSLAEFGGTAHWVPHWAWGQTDGGSGRCFPSGHASTGFAFFAVYLGLRGARPGAARLVLAAVLLSGGVFGVTQMVRGAHYLSHTFWTAWFCWTLSALAVHALWPARSRLDAGASSPPASGAP